VTDSIDLWHFSYFITFLLADKMLVQYMGSLGNSCPLLKQRYDYMVQVTRWQPADLYPDVKNVVSIEQKGAVLATAKDVQDASRK
jgi:hypothetical protein